MSSSPQYSRTSRPPKSRTHTPSASFSFSPLAQYQQAHQHTAGGAAAAAAAAAAQAQVQPPNARMSPASRYHSNLKVLRRRDPSIISIFDQFSHVCVYHHNGQKWEKHGFEGSMFLFERESYPPYGFYILNRAAVEDYIQRLYPEDDITAHGGYLMLRSYPQFTTARLDAVAHNTAFSGKGEPDKFAEVYAFSNDGGVTSKDKGEGQTIGLWTFTADGREPLMDVMLRLHSYIKKNLPYPEEYRYGPDRPPPPNPHPRVTGAVNPANSGVNDNDSDTAYAGTNNNNNSGMTGSNGYDSDYSYNVKGPAPGAIGVSELDKLFSKFLPNAAAPAAVTPAGFEVGPGPGLALPAALGMGLPGGNSTSNPQSTASMSVQSLFASLGGGPQQQQQQAVPAQAQPYIAPTQSMTSGLSLLNTIFASASVPTPPAQLQGQQQLPSMGYTPTGAGGYSHLPQPPNTIFSSFAPPYPPPAIPPYPPLPSHSQSHQSHLQPPPQQSIPIHSPTPKSSRLPPPQVLSQNVIGSLLGYTSDSQGNRSDDDDGGGSGEREGEGPDLESPTHPSSRDGDNELDEGSFSGSGGNVSSEDGSSAVARKRVQGKVRGGILPVSGLAGGQGQGLGKEKKAKAKGGKNGIVSEGMSAGLSVASSGSGGGTVAGDVTPRPGYFAGDHLKNLSPPSASSISSVSSAPSTAATATATAQQNQNHKPRDGRPLVPFEPNSELWPYPPPSQQDAAASNDDNGSEAGGASTNGSGANGGNGDIVELDWEDMSALSDLKAFERLQKAQAAAGKKSAKAQTKANAGESGAVGEGAVVAPAGGRKKKEKKNKKEKLEAMKKEREEIEKSWDVPSSSMGEGMSEVANPANWDYPSAGLVVSNGWGGGGGSKNGGGANNKNGGDVSSNKNGGGDGGSSSKMGGGDRSSGKMGGGKAKVTNGHANGKEMMNLNGKSVPIPKVFNDDSPPASPSPVPSPEMPLSPARRGLAPAPIQQQQQQSPSRVVVQQGSEYEYRPLTPQEDEVSAISSSIHASGGGGKKKKNRRKLNTSEKAKSITSPPPAATAEDPFEEGRFEVDKEKVMEGLLSAFNHNNGSGGSGVEKEVFVSEVMRLMKSERFVDELWRGYCAGAKY
ncbi:hypothetical protein D9756_008338 [Leucocoprinus leucothites]|uniref:Uncharacterized protein n=1 Tax=Leucocoprinus leucothites TaxID=201217 RepID=A0A8H5CZY8_9AGAR|nr:hypothetical protein D9756_008338 [Leucoagaricus leucothites]